MIIFLVLYIQLTISAGISSVAEQYDCSRMDNVTLLFGFGTIDLESVVRITDRINTNTIILSLKFPLP